MSDLTSVYTAPANLFPPPSGMDNVQIFVGNATSASSNATLQNNQIQGVLNVAYDLDDQPTGSVARQADAQRPWQDAVTSSATSRYPEQFAKVGLIDGEGNLETTLLAAIYMADQLFTFPPTTPVPPLANSYGRGNLLIHCFAGQSRSVTVAALYIYYKFKVSLGDPNLGTFAAIYANVQSLRGDASPPPPTQGMQDAANSIVQAYSALFPQPTLAA